MADRNNQAFPIGKLYERRFAGSLEKRKQIYSVLCADFFQQFVPEDSVVLDLAAGYCEFINAIKAKRKIAVDINPSVRERAGQGVEVVCSSVLEMGGIIPDGSVDVVFASNLLEHLKRNAIVGLLCEVRRVLRPKGRFLILQPNYRYCSKDYWMFFDHITALDDRSLTEILEVSGFTIDVCIPRFLPYTMNSRLPKSALLLKMYLKLPPARWLFGKQAFICAEISSY